MSAPVEVAWLCTRVFWPQRSTKMMRNYRVIKRAALAPAISSFRGVEGTAGRARVAGQGRLASGRRRKSKWFGTVSLHFGDFIWKMHASEINLTDWTDSWASVWIVSPVLVIARISSRHFL